MGAQLGSKGAMSEINMTPLIDIVLVVLIIMMVNIPIQIEEMGLKLPGTQVKKTEPNPNSEQLVIALYDDGQIALNRRVMAEDKMLYELTRRLRPLSKKNVFVDAHTDVLYGVVVDAVDLARRAGASNVGLAKMKDGGPLPPTSVDAGSGMPRGIFLGSPLIAGEMTEKRADESIQRLKGKLQSCYLKRLGAKPSLTGDYTVYVEIGPQGEFLDEVPPAVEKDNVQDLDLRDCMEATLTELRFAPLGEQKTAWIRYPILFSPG